MDTQDRQLRQKRELLYQRFDHIKSPKEVFNFQRTLADTIIESEINIARNYNRQSWHYHLDRLHALGDAVAWRCINDFTIRQLGKYEAVRTSLLDQKQGLLQLMESFRSRAKSELFVFADLTRCITIGDVILRLRYFNIMAETNIHEMKRHIPRYFTCTR